MTLIMTRPPCAKCDKPAISRINRYWVCGECLMRVYAKQAKEKERLLFEE